MTGRLPISCLCALGAVTPLEAAPPSIPATVKSSIMNRVDYGYNPAIVLGIVNKDGRAYFGYGVANRQNAIPADEHTFFEVGSVTKVFTTTLLANMTQQGEVALSDPVQKYLPSELTMPERDGIQITLEHLATHYSGLPYLPSNLPLAHLDNPFADYTLELLYQFLDGFTLPRDPGGGYEYSNVGVGLLGHALALHANEPYEALLRERLLDPLELKDIRITLSGPEELRRAIGYEGAVARPAFRMASLEGAGELVATVSDLLTFLEYNLGLRSSDLQPAFSMAAQRRRPTDTAGVDIGLGWLLLNLNGVDYVFHDGDTPG